MDLLYLDLNYKVPCNCLSMPSLPLIATTSFLMAPFRVIGLNYQLSSSITQTSISINEKFLKSWNSKSYNFSNTQNLIMKVKIPVFKNYKELIICLLNSKTRVFYSATILESIWWWFSFTTKASAISLGNTYIKNSYINISLIACWFTLWDTLTYSIEGAIARETFNYFNLFQHKNKSRSLYHIFIDAFVSILDKEGNCKNSFSRCHSIFFTKFVCWCYALKASESGLSTKKSIDIFILHSLFYPIFTAQNRYDAQNIFFPYRYKHFYDALVKIYYKEGIIQGLYRGFIFNTIYALPKYYLIPYLFYMNSNANYTNYLEHKEIKITYWDKLIGNIKDFFQFN